MTDGVTMPDGGTMRLEDFCNVGPRGSRLTYTSGIVTADEELAFVENERVGLAIMEQAIEGWNALLDLALAEAAS